MYLTTKIFQKCEDELEQLDIHVRGSDGLLNSDWIKLFEQAGYVVFRLVYDPDLNPFGIQNELEKGW